MNRLTLDLLLCIVTTITFSCYSETYIDDLNGECVPVPLEDFDTDIDVEDWAVWGDASWVYDSYSNNGWLEMTDTYKTRKGAIFKTSEALDPGDLHIKFKFYTGPNTDYGADGFAISIFNVEDVVALEDLIDNAASGSGLGFGVSGPYGNWEGDAFHIEIDTCHNTIYYNEHTDPTANDHIAVLLNGDPSEHVLWYDAGELEDSSWHQMEVQIQDSSVTVKLDNNQIINETVEGFSFRGGFIGFTGTTGDWYNYHRFDDLEFPDSCAVP